MRYLEDRNLPIDGKRTGLEKRVLIAMRSRRDVNAIPGAQAHANTSGGASNSCT